MNRQISDTSSPCVPSLHLQTKEEIFGCGWASRHFNDFTFGRTDTQPLVEAPLDGEDPVRAAMATHVQFVRIVVGRPVVNAHQEEVLVQDLQWAGVVRSGSRWRHQCEQTEAFESADVKSAETFRLVTLETVPGTMSDGFRGCRTSTFQPSFILCFLTGTWA